MQSRSQGPLLLGPIREWSWMRVLIQAQCQWNRSFQIYQLKISTKIIIIIIIFIIIVIIIIIYYYYFYTKSVSLFFTRANTNNVDRFLFFYTSRHAYFKAHILRAVIINPLL